MKKNQLVIVLVLIVVLAQSCSYNRIGDMTMVSTRNIDSKAEYVLIQRNVEAKASSKTHDALKQAIDNAVRPIQGGEFLKNVIISMKGNGRKIKVSGDVWGIPSVSKSVEVSVNAEIRFESGDQVSFKLAENGKIIIGKIIGVGTKATVQYTTEPNGLIQAKTKLIEIEYEKLTLIKKNDVSVPDAPNEQVQNSSFFKGDCVAFKKNASEDWINGKIIETNQYTALVEYHDPLDPSRMKEIEVEYKKLIKNSSDKCLEIIPPVKEMATLKVGDFVSFKKFDNGPAIKGKIIQINQETAIIEYPDPSDNAKVREIELEIKKLTKSEK